MKVKQIMFFATLLDLQSILIDVENSFDIKYIEMGLFDDRNSKTYKTIFDMSNVGYIQKGDWNYDRRLMIIEKKENLKIREVPQRKGGVKFAIDPTLNPKSICLQIGGIYNETEKILVAGKVGTISTDKFSTDIFKFFHSKISKHFKKHSEFFIGIDAQEKLLNGWRLVTNDKMSKEFDLKPK